MGSSLLSPRPDTDRDATFTTLAVSYALLPSRPVITRSLRFIVTGTQRR